MFRTAVVLVTLLVCGVLAGNKAGGGRPDAIVKLEFAGTAEGVAQVMSATGWTAADVRAALLWDDLFLVCYAFFIAIIASRVGRALGGRAALLGAAAACAALVAAAFDAIENTALLHTLEGRDVAWLAAVCAGLKFALVTLAALAGVSLLLLAAVKRLRRSAPSSTPAGQQATALPKEECDLVMKGGVTSGIVYPRAVAKLAARYRLRNVGGASAGAIAAAAAAAAECGRLRGKANSFDELASLPEELGRDGKLMSLFAPGFITRGPFEFATSFLGNEPLLLKLSRALATFAAFMPVAFALGLLPPALLVLGAATTPTPAWGVTGAMALAPLTLLLGLVAALAFHFAIVLPRRDYGLCSGVDGRESLGEWLSATFSRLAGSDSSHVLLFGELWTAGLAEDVNAANLRKEDRVINLEALTTSLTNARPYRLPDLARKDIFFRKEELERVLPADVVESMVENAPAPGFKVAPGFVQLPPPHLLPVVFAVRLSLSFPVLISAVKLWSVNWAAHNNWQKKKRKEQVQLDELWLSDGGISSNFPIHFFDALMPRRPTFGIDLAESKRPRAPRRPRNNNQNLQARWLRIDGTGGFVSALVESMQAFMDNLQARAPGFRDRIVRVYLTKDQGGLNLDMPPDTVEKIADLGEQAATELYKFSMENHRAVRLRLLLGELDPLLCQFAQRIDEHPELLDRELRAYSWRSDAQYQRAKKLIEALKQAGRELELPPGEEDTVHLGHRAPKPASELRATPRV